jgi:hypothetical protein
MNNLETNINWQLSNFCKAECSYCPTNLRGGVYPEENKDYVKISQLITDHYNLTLDRRINWTFDGGEPLDLHNLVKIIKTAKADRNSVALNTNGGNLWMDWWAIEPHVNRLILTYHYWQNYSLIKYILDIFKEKNKPVVIKMPIRPTHFDEDMDRVKIVESEYSIIAEKIVLYNNADPIGGQFPYSKRQLMILSGIDPDANPYNPEEEKKIPLIKEKNDNETKTYTERITEVQNANPKYFGKLCNAGIEKLFISHNGYASGSTCGNKSLGNIWDQGWAPPSDPQICGMLACINPSDQKITKFI